ncbi:MAG TPA: MBL fold metallo-hydrolase [Actinomycetota bacterium]|nr:MBL fold metallo-hydrolase [Actinomycetota bacterium]
MDCGIFDAQLEDGGWGDLVTAVDAAGARLEDVTRLVVTHPHIDHYGMAARVMEATGAELWMHRESSEEVQIYRDPSDAASQMKQMLVDHGVDPEEVDALAAYEDWRPYVSGVVEPDRPVEGGESFSCGGRTWSFVHTPGHSRSHICLAADEERILISGDHLLPSVTPHIDFRRGDDDPLGDFLASLEKIERLAPDLVLPGHGRPFDDGADRARAVARFHDRRLGSILQVVRHEERTAQEITDEIFGSTLLHFERRLALGEAIAHLVYLRRRGEVDRVRGDDGVFRYRKASRRRAAEDEA